MTAQIDDLFRLNGSEYAVSGISNGELFEPSLLDLEPFSSCTACWRGYQAVFTVIQKRLVLDDLHVNLLGAAPEINGVKPNSRGGRRDLFQSHYIGLNYHLNYDGGLLIASGFIDNLYVHLGFHPAWKYETVIELVFVDGILQHEFDRSENMAEVRRKFGESRESKATSQLRTTEEIHDFIERSFDRTYWRKD